MYKQYLIGIYPPLPMFHNARGYMLFQHDGLQLKGENIITLVNWEFCSKTSSSILITENIKKKLSRKRDNKEPLTPDTRYVFFFFHGSNKYTNGSHETFFFVYFVVYLPLKCDLIKETLVAHRKCVDYQIGTRLSILKLYSTNF